LLFGEEEDIAAAVFIEDVNFYKQIKGFNRQDYLQNASCWVNLLSWIPLYISG